MAMRVRRKTWRRTTEFGAPGDPFEPASHNTRTYGAWCAAEVDRINFAGGRSRIKHHAYHNTVAVEVFTHHPQEART